MNLITNDVFVILQVTDTTVEPRLSEPIGGHTIRPDNQ